MRRHFLRSKQAEGPHVCVCVCINQSSALGRLGGLYAFLIMLQLTLHLHLEALHLEAIYVVLLPILLNSK